MSNKHIQLEIFEQGYKTKKNKEPRAVSHQAPQRNQFPNQLCVIAACSLIAMLVVFALGIERGKAITRKQTIKPQPPAHDRLVSKKTIKKVPAPEVKEAPIVDKTLEKEEKSDTLISSQYAIQIATYNKDSSYIQKEVARLEQKGYHPFVKTSGSYMIIFAGNFKNRKSAEKQLRVLKKTYRDCFIKKI